MHYTASQFRKVEHQFLQQFQLKTLDFYDQNVNSNNLIQYKKLLNNIKTRRKLTIQKKQKFVWIHKKNTFDHFIDQKQYSKYQQSPLNQQSSAANNQQKQNDIGFYLTQNIWNFAKIKNQSPQTNSKQNSRGAQRNSKIVQANNQSKQGNSRIEEGTNSRSLLKSRGQLNNVNNVDNLADNQNLNIDNLNDRIYGQYSVLQCLKHEQSQVQQAIFCFKKRIMALQQHLNSEDIKSKQVDRLLVQNNNQMLRAKHTNQQVKSAFIKTKKHFQLDLQGRKQIQQKFNQKNKQQFDQSIVNHIYMKKMKHHIQQQEKQLIQLDQIRQELHKKQQKYKSIYLKQQQLYKAYQSIINIDPSQFNKKPIVSILDKDFQEYENQQKQKNNHQKQNHEKSQSKHKRNKFTIKEGHGAKDSIKQHFHHKKDSHFQSIKKKLSLVVKQIIQLYRKMKHYQASKISQFKILINQRDQKQVQYNKTLIKMTEIYKTLYEQIQIIDPSKKQQLQDLMNEINLLNTKKNFFNTNTNAIQYRLKFYLSKQLMILKKIIQKWIKTDKLTNRYFDNILFKFNDFTNTQTNSHSHTNNFNKAPHQQIQQRQLSIDDSKNLLITCFQNWHDYLPFLDIIHQSSYIYRFMSKTKLFKLFKRIIKTKLNNKNVPTQTIFQKALNLSFQEGKNIHIKRIQNLISVFRDLYHYLIRVKSGTIKLNCAVNYDNPIQIRQSQSNEVSKLVSKNEIQRFSTKKQLTLNNQRNSNGLKSQTPQSKQLYNTFSQSRKFLSNNNGKEQDIITKLKKKKFLKPVLNIHQFYQDLRQEIQKVNKISTY